MNDSGYVVNLDIFWLKDKSPEDSDDLPEPDVLAQEIAGDLETALEQFTSIAAKLKPKPVVAAA
jgi:type I restriction enzyme M protein